MTLRRIIPTLLAAAMLALPVAALADFVSGSDANVSSQKTIDNDLYIAGSSVTVSGTVNGDVYAAGNNILIEGNVKGDVFVAGQTINVHGNVAGSLRAFGQTINLTGAQVSGSTTLAGQTVSADTSTKIGGGLQLAAQNATIRAGIGRGITGAVRDLTLGGQTGKDVNVALSKLTVENTAVINGNLTYRSSDTANISSDAHITGSVQRHQPPPTRHFGYHSLVIWRLIEFVAAFVTGFVLLLLARRPVQKIANAVRERPWAALGWGLVTLLVTLPICLILAITVIGIPLALILLVFFLVSLYLSKIFVILGLLGRTDELGLGKATGILALGLIAYYLLTSIPFVGWIVGFVVAIWGLGALATSLFRRGGRAAHAQ